MRYGASIFLGLVEAELASYEDCRRFLITCPVCREAVFKGVLPRRDGHETHYFSHYREVPSEQAERCELRVSSITKAQAEEARAEARGQALAIFRARFRECVLWSRAHVIFGLPPNPAIERGVAHMLSRPLWRDFARKSQKYVRAEWASEATP